MDQGRDSGGDPGVAARFDNGVTKGTHPRPITSPRARDGRPVDSPPIRIDPARPRPVRPREPQRMSADRVPMSKEGYEKLKAELDKMVNEDMPRIAEAIAQRPGGA